MFKTNRILLPLLVLLYLSSVHGMLAYGADAVPPPDQDSAGWLLALYTAVTSKQWGVVAGILLIGVVYPVRRWGPNVLKTPLGGIFLAFLVSLLGTMGIALAAGAHLTLGIAVTAITTAATAAGLWEWIKSHIPGMQAAADKATEQVTAPGTIG